MAPLHLLTSIPRSDGHSRRPTVQVRCAEEEYIVSVALLVDYAPTATDKLIKMQRERPHEIPRTIEFINTTTSSVRAFTSYIHATRSEQNSLPVLRGWMRRSTRFEDYIQAWRLGKYCGCEGFQQGMIVCMERLFERYPDSFNIRTVEVFLDYLEVIGHEEDPSIFFTQALSNLMQKLCCSNSGLEDAFYVTSKLSRRRIIKIMMHILIEGRSSLPLPTASFTSLSNQLLYPMH